MRRIARGALPATENGFQLAPLIFGSGFANVETSLASTQKEISRPFPRHYHYRAAQFYAISVTLPNFKPERMRAPTLVRLYFRAEPTWTPHLAAAQIQASSGNSPCHRIFSPYIHRYPVSPYAKRLQLGIVTWDHRYAKFRPHRMKLSADGSASSTSRTNRRHISPGLLWTAVTPHAYPFQRPLYDGLAEDHENDGSMGFQERNLR